MRWIGSSSVIGIFCIHESVLEEKIMLARLGCRIFARLVGESCDCRNRPKNRLEVDIFGGIATHSLSI